MPVGGSSCRIHLPTTSESGPSGSGPRPPTSTGSSGCSTRTSPTAGPGRPAGSGPVSTGSRPSCWPGCGTAARSPTAPNRIRSSPDSCWTT
ncbi:hypothetical protein F8144_22360 [Streptomyces triticiradicis]|uniref:Uncharacterized protein n=1 Tax=Streptomyces triticiradicis TaxID=2651189 RepID=A0A7J5DC82_9ACTN|nr:hypothetical protein F8144_22360 [Streptomyces triticiradicis]